MKCVVKVENLVKKKNNIKLVDGINFEVNSGDIYGFLGPNGAGKSTTIKMILGLVKPTNGKIQINNYDIKTDKKNALSSIGAMIEAPSFYDYLTGYKNLCIYKNLYNLPSTRINEVLKLVGLENEKNKKVRNYSLGMKQRLAIARAFINKPSIVILDEPTNGLDPTGIVEIRNLIKKLSNNNTTFIICSHILSEIQEICNKVVIINKGKVVQQGLVKDLLSDEFDEYEICTPALNKAKLILNNISVVHSIKSLNDKLQIKILKGRIGIINKELSLNDIEITSIDKKEKNLETYFFNALGKEVH